MRTGTPFNPGRLEPAGIPFRSHPTDHCRHRSQQTRRCELKEPGAFSIDGRPIIQEITAMRLRLQELEVIRQEVNRVDPAAEIYLYGSRVDDSARGGDIDLLVVSNRLGFRDVLRLRTRILDRIGWQQLDLLVRRREALDEPRAASALQTGTKI